MRIRHIKGSEEAVAQSPYVINEPGAFKGQWREKIFLNENPIYLEVGMGMGKFIRTHAVNNPEINYIGFEINTTVLYKSLKRYEKLLEDLSKEKEGSGEMTDEGGAESGELLRPGEGTKKLYNLRFIRQDARFLADDFAEGEVDRIYLNFSDPWPKDKNANKRLTSPVFMKLYDRILKKDGIIEFKTDNEGLFDYSLESIPASGWKLEAVTRDLHRDAAMNEGNIMTEYEEKFSGKGNPIYKLIASR
ncbi:MAG: tRNA (guanosine(46)-N7)-methyltransferase TrmB [Candidatus Avilachnospira sp.]|jgi:tRNA (guanine-N7-)-methyltransferase